VELEGLEGGHFEAEQYECLLSLTRAIRDRYALRHVAGHEHIAPTRKADPGSGFDWIVLQKSSAFEGMQFPHQTMLR
jgi:AmpD protein